MKDRLSTVLETTKHGRAPFKLGTPLAILSHVEPQLTQAITDWISEANRLIWDAEIPPHILPLISDSHTSNFTHLVLTVAMKL